MFGRPYGIDPSSLFNLGHLDCNGIIALYFICGGTKSERQAQAKTFKTRIHRLDCIHFPDAIAAFLLLEKFKIDESKLYKEGARQAVCEQIRQLANNHNGWKHPWIMVVDLSAKQDNDLVHCSSAAESATISSSGQAIVDSCIPENTEDPIHCLRTADSLTISFSDQAIVKAWRGTKLSDKAMTSLRPLIEQCSVPTLVLDWNPKLNSDLFILERLSSEVKVVRVQNCPRIFDRYISEKKRPDRERTFTSMFLDFTTNLAGLDRLDLVGCGQTFEDLQGLQSTLPRLGISVNGKIDEPHLPDQPS